MLFKSKIFGVLFATIFSCAVLLPIATQAFHAIDNHKHEVCHDFSTHFHKQQLDCSICDFHFSIFHFTPQTFQELIVFVSFYKVQDIVLFEESSTFLSHYYLRGPPRIS